MDTKDPSSARPVARPKVAGLSSVVGLSLGACRFPPSIDSAFSEGIEIEAPMTDEHARLLAAVARHRERERDEYESSADATDFAIDRPRSICAQH